MRSDEAHQGCDRARATCERSPDPPTVLRNCPLLQVPPLLLSRPRAPCRAVRRPRALSQRPSFRSALALCDAARRACVACRTVERRRVARSTRNPASVVDNQVKRSRWSHRSDASAPAGSRCIVGVAIALAASCRRAADGARRSVASADGREKTEGDRVAVVAGRPQAVQVRLRRGLAVLRARRADDGAATVHRRARVVADHGSARTTRAGRGAAAAAAATRAAVQAATRAAARTAAVATRAASRTAAARRSAAGGRRRSHLPACVAAVDGARASTAACCEGEHRSGGEEAIRGALEHPAFRRT
jgi:hypothetical protein